MSTLHLHKFNTWLEAGVDFVHSYEKFRTINIFMNAKMHALFAQLTVYTFCERCPKSPTNLIFFLKHLWCLRQTLSAPGRFIWQTIKKYKKG